MPRQQERGMQGGNAMSFSFPIDQARGWNFAVWSQAAEWTVSGLAWRTCLVQYDLVLSDILTCFQCSGDNARYKQLRWMANSRQTAFTGHRCTMETVEQVHSALRELRKSRATGFA